MRPELAAPDLSFRPMFGGIMGYAGGRVFASLSNIGLALKMNGKHCWHCQVRSPCAMSRKPHPARPMSSFPRLHIPALKNSGFGSSARSLLSLT
ncbi:hypothetical protein [Asaia krungthepensis]|uniref:hypothetical protein n=1 Tax=Asaia krungthepensis TaxID=220990 RepID=UPI002230FF16|nr:hypothetical protein [Asaia krungthepensis]